MAKVPKVYKNACAMYDLRMNAEGLDWKLVIKQFKKIAKRYVFQLERGEENGYLHYQCRISLIKKHRKPELKKLFDIIPFPNFCEPTVNAVYYTGDVFYVMKDETRVDGPWDERQVEMYIPRHYRNITEEGLYPFQKTIWNILEDDSQFNSRKIDLVYCQSGNKGKSTIAHLARLKLGAIVIPAIINDAKELVQVACNMCMDRQIRNPSAVFIDMPRAVNKDRLYGLYSAIEVIKDGYLYDVRNHFKSWDIDSPHVWVFTNSLPDTSMLSLDRWNIWTINDDLELVEYLEG